MNFHLEFPITPFQTRISYTDPIMLVGSCFAENIGERLHDAKFNTSINPNGILYDPLSLAKAISRYVKNDLLKKDELFFANESWNSWEHHSRFSDPDKAKCIDYINTSITNAHEQIEKVKWLFITFGSAFSYSLKAGNIPVANCHKVPQKEFSKSLLKPEKIISEYNKLLSEIQNINPEINIVLTVSPVRYIRDGVVENNLSKSILLQSVHELVKENENVFYFPAYELVIDDLRDYRFYKSDLVHPNGQAIDYVFEKLMLASFDTGSQQLFERIREIRNAQMHRPFNENTDAHKKFKAVYADRCKLLKTEFPFLDLSNEMLFFSS